VAVAVLVAAVLLLLFRHSLFGRNLGGVAAQVLAGLLMVWARMTFRGRSFHAAADPTEGGLVTTGPYRFLRHPIYAAILLFVVAGVLAHPSPTNALIGIAAVAATAMRIFAEERLLVWKYPEYAVYAARVKRVIPFVF
jgi:protein-S-isoprenylcysteine O-methyltransferase Ste14